MPPHTTLQTAHAPCPISTGTALTVGVARDRARAADRVVWRAREVARRSRTAPARGARRGGRGGDVDGRAREMSSYPNGEFAVALVRNRMLYQSMLACVKSATGNAVMALHLRYATIVLHMARGRSAHRYTHHEASLVATCPLTRALAIGRPAYQGRADSATDCDPTERRAHGRGQAVDVGIVTR